MNTELIIQITSVIYLVFTMVQRIKELWPNMNHVLRFDAEKLLSTSLSIGLCFLVSLDATPLLSLKIPWPFGVLITGLCIGTGSNIFHDTVKRVTGK